MAFMESRQSRRAVQPGEPAPNFRYRPCTTGEPCRSPTTVASAHSSWPNIVGCTARSVGGTSCSYRPRQRSSGRWALRRWGSSVRRWTAFAFYVRFRPIRCALGADPDLTTHRAYGLPQRPMTTEIWGAVESASKRFWRASLEYKCPSRGATEAIGRLDGFEATDSERAELERHQAQFTGQVLVDREGIVRWSNIECAKEGLAGIDKVPSDEELLAAAGALSR